jgi:LysM domain-containing protein
MSSLPSHLLETGDHGQLDFHPSCPVCRRERLFPALRSRPVFSRRLQAALATGVLALSTAAPSLAAIPERDRQQEGVAAPEQRKSGDPAQPRDGLDDPDFDPGGDTALPFDVGAPDTTPNAEGDEDTGEAPPIDVEPQEDPSAHLVAPNEPETEAPPGDGAPIPPAEAVPVTPAPGSAEPTPAPSPTLSPDEPASAEQPAATHEPASPDSRRSEAKSQENRDHGSPNRTPSTGSDVTTRLAPPQSSPPAPVDDVAPSVVTSPESSILPTPTAPASAPRQVAVASPSAPAENDPRPPQGQARFYVVQSGESLWLIARKLLGPSASPARIAREVDRLWELNKDRIGTGNPDLLMVGTKLRLR